MPVTAIAYAFLIPATAGFVALLPLAFPAPAWVHGLWMFAAVPVFAFSYAVIAGLFRLPDQAAQH